MLPIKKLIFPFLTLCVLLSACDSNSDDTAEIEITDLEVGSGDLVQNQTTIIIAWEGRLPDGSIFDSSTIQEEDLIFTLGVGKVIAGLDEGIQGMRIGGIRKIVIPPSKAFGRQGSCLENGSCPVPGNTTVTYEVEIKSRMLTVRIEEVSEGTGPPAEVGDLIHVQYIGALLSGTVFDASEQHGLNAVLEFRLGNGDVIEGWEIGVAGMRVGGTRFLTIPPELAYGENPNGNVPAWSVLVFRIDLVQIVDEG